MTDVILVLVTVPDAEKGAEIGTRLVQERLAACANVVPGLRSIYSWQGKLTVDSEALMILKTRESLFESLRQRVVALHPYQCPEILRLDVAAGHVPYLEWVRSSVGPSSAASASGD